VFLLSSDRVHLGTFVYVTPTLHTSLGPRATYMTLIKEVRENEARARCVLECLYSLLAVPTIEFITV